MQFSSNIEKSINHQEKKVQMEKLKAAAANCGCLHRKDQTVRTIEQPTPEMFDTPFSALKLVRGAVRYSRYSSQQTCIIYRDIEIIGNEILEKEEQPGILPSIAECI